MTRPAFRVMLRRVKALAAGMWLLVWVSGCVGAGVNGPAIGLSAVGETPRVLRVRGLDPRVLESFDTMGQEQKEAALRVWVADAPAGAPSLLGDVSQRAGDIVFSPRYPFQAGIKYRARFDPAGLASGSESGSRIVSEFMIPAPPRKPVVHVDAIYPTADVLPENLLKFYIHFSGPMSRGDAYRHIHLVNDAGTTVAYPFLELGEELWNPEMTRFTLFFDPGRIKQGLVPRLEAGPALESGRMYTLVVDGDWQDDQHRPMVETARKKFRAGPVDSTQPTPSRWRIVPPPAGSTQDLVIEFDESLDWALLERVLSVRDSGGKPVGGKISVAEHEKHWTFTPQTPWQAARYLLVVETILEDNAGNSIGRAFEVDLNRGSQPAGPAVVEIPFNVGSRN